MSKSKGVLDIISPGHSNDDLHDLREKVDQTFNEMSEPQLLARYEERKNFEHNTGVNTTQDSGI